MRQLTIVILMLLALTSLGQDNDSLDSANHILATKTPPSYPGGLDKMDKFFKKNLKCAKGERKIQGTIYIEFCVNEKGSLSDFRVIQGLTESLDSCVLETAKRMPKWTQRKVTPKPVGQSW